MQHTRVLVVAGVMLAWQSTAHAGLPAWCKGQSLGDQSYGDFKSEYPQRQDDVSRLRTLLEWECTTGSAAVKQHADVEQARAELSKRLYMNDADWTDAIEYVQKGGYSSSAGDYQVSGNTLASLGPFDQYLVINHGLRMDRGGADALYLTDALEQNLTEAGRFAFIQSCVSNDHTTGNDPEPAYWAVCQGDIAKFDPSKFAAELRADTSHPAVERMALRLKLGEVLDSVKDLGDRYKAIVKKDDVYQKILDEANKGRQAWQDALAGQKDLLALVQQVDSATVFHSRKQFAGCEDKAWKFVTEAAGKLHASAFKGMHDDPENPFAGFGQAAGPVLLENPQLNLAASALSLCMRESGAAKFLGEFLTHTPGYRGPRSAALHRLYMQKFVADDTTVGEIKLRGLGGRPYPTSDGNVWSITGVVAKLKVKGDRVVVSQPKTSITTEECVKSHETGKLIDWDTAGRPVYERICDKSGMVKHDTTGGDIEVTARTAKWLKPGVTFSVVGAVNGEPGDAIAVWPNKTAKLPTLLLGASIK